MISVLERRGEGILIPLDIKGAFDRVWWERLKSRFKAKGMTRRALKLIKSYLFKRFLKVVTQGSASERKEVFSSVPQGGVWSPDFWDFDISELPDALSSEADDFEYADDIGLWYEITDENRAVIVAIINLDLESLIQWGNDNMTTFEPDKAAFMVVSQRKNPFDPFENSAGITMGGMQVKRVESTKLVGFTFDSKLKFGEMIDKLAKKARVRLGAIRRLKPMLDSNNLETMYKMFVRSILEYGSVVYMGASDTNLAKLDRVQKSAERIGGFTIESLSSRREAAAVSLALDLLDGEGYGELQQHKSQLIEPLRLSKKRTRYVASAGLQLKSKARTNSLDQYKRSYLGSIHKIWSKLPQTLISEGQVSGWCKIKKRAKQFLTGKWDPNLTQMSTKKIKNTNNNNTYNTVLNNELNKKDDWNAIREELKNQGISLNNNGIFTQLNVTCK